MFPEPTIMWAGCVCSVQFSEVDSFCREVSFRNYSFNTLRPSYTTGLCRGHASVQDRRSVDDCRQVYRSKNSHCGFIKKRKGNIFAWPLFISPRTETTSNKMKDDVQVPSSLSGEVRHGSGSFIYTIMVSSCPQKPPLVHFPYGNLQS